MGVEVAPTPTKRLVDWLAEAGCEPRLSGNGFVARCPVPGHGQGRGDRNPSLSIDEGNDGTPLIKCHAGCETDSVLRALSRSWADVLGRSGVLPRPPAGAKARQSGDEPTRHPTIEKALDAAWWGATNGRKDGRKTVHYYWGETEGVVGAVLRIDFDDDREKALRRVRRDGDAWICKDLRAPKPLYNLRALLADPKATAIAVEGEKCVDTLGSIGVLATTSCGGSNAKTSETDWSPLKGRLVIILPDNDRAGAEYAHRVTGEAWRARAFAVQVLRIPGLAEGGDIADWISEQRSAGLDSEAIRGRFDLVLANHAESADVGSGALPDSEGSGGIGSAADPFDGRWFDNIDETWTEQEPPAQRWLVCARRLRGLPDVGLLARGVVGLLAGAGGIGKTEVVIGLAIAIATEGLWLDHYPVDDAEGRVLLLVAEEDEVEMRRRLHRMTRRLSLDQRAALRGRLVIVPMHGRSIALLARSSKSAAPERTAFLAALCARLEAEAGPDGWAAILIGPLSRLAGVAIDADNENATALVQALETLTELPGSPTVLVDCHTPATSRKSGQPIEDVRPRGPTGLFDGVRWAAAMHRPRRGAPIEFAVTKANRSPDDLPVIQLERGPNGVLRCTGQAPSAEERKEQREQDRDQEYQQDLETRIAHVAPTLGAIYDGESVARETIAVAMGRRLPRNRTAVDLAASRGLVRVAGGTLKHPRFAPITSPNEEGGAPPYTSGRDGTDSSPPSDPVQPHPRTEWDGTGRNHHGIDDGQPEQPKGRRRNARRKR